MSAHYLRLSLTDDCNLRCIYCMPEAAQPPAARPRLTDEEVVRLARLFVAEGVTKIRLTGGEPTLRPRLVELVAALRDLPGLEEVVLTTNGLLLDTLAAPLARAGLRRVNVNLPALDPDRYRERTRGGSLEQVWAGLRAAEAAGLALRINHVILRDDDVTPPALAALTLDRPWQVRMIEAMPFGPTAAIQQALFRPAGDVRERIASRMGPLTRIGLNGSTGWRLPGARGTLRFIAPISEPFCSNCNRMRLTADGRLRPCLLRDEEVDLLAPMRAGASDEVLRALWANLARTPRPGHALRNGLIPSGRAMSEIGG